MSTETTSPDARHCDWTGEDTEQKHYILRTTEGRGEELVSESALRGVDPKEFADLAARVARLEGRAKADRTAKAEASAPARRPGRPRKSAAAVPAQKSGE